jgi:benzoate/toluate 1,2-dioxygenase subunit alpha
VNEEANVAIETAAGNIDHLVQQDRVHHSIYTDPAIFRAEMRQIFGRTWVYLAHDSEIASPGDYVTRLIGLQPVIVTRDPDGDVHVLLNRCRHRGALVCREPGGNSSYFRCMYHGWAYNNEGRLIGVPLRHRYPETFDLDGLWLVAVPRVERYRGMIFASLNPGIEPLEAFLGAARHHIDVMLDFAEDGEIDVRSGCTKHEYRGNWKFQAENGVDGYHANTVHESLQLLDRWRAERRAAETSRLRNPQRGEGWCESFPQGHSLMARPAEPGAAEQLQARYPEWTARLAEKHPLDEMLVKHNLFIFPNLYVRIDHIRVILPRAVDRTEVLMYPYRLKGVPEEVNVSRLRGQEDFHGSAGFGTVDDMMAFEAVQQGLQAEGVDWLYFSRGMHDEIVRADGVRVNVHASDELPMRELYRAWKRLMTDEY